MAALMSQDQEALKELYERYAAPLYGVIIRIIKEDSLAEEVLQDCFICYWNKAQTYDQEIAAPFTWMYRIAKNRALNAVRDRASRQLRSDLVIADTSAGENTESDYDLKGLIAQLDDQDRKMLSLSFYQGYSHEDIQTIENIPLGTVKSRIRRALKNLRTLAGPRLAIVMALTSIYML